MAFDAYLKFAEPPTPGEAELGKGYNPDNTADKTGWIEMTEYGFSVTMAVSAARSSGTGAATTGKGKLEPFTFKKTVDATSMRLAFHAAAGTIFRQIVINIFATTTDGKESKPYLFLSMLLKGAVISSCGFSGGGGDELPTEDIAITYGSLDCKYWPFSVDEDTGAITPGGKGVTTFNWSTIKNSGTKS
jgi:type VI protein secretion system component Hcp